MKTLARIAAAILAVVTALSLSATGAAASTITIRRDDAGGSPYSGGFRFDSLVPMTLNLQILGMNAVVQCDSIGLNGNMGSDGSNFVLSAVSFGNCTSDIGNVHSIGFEGLPYTQATLRYDPLPGGRDGVLILTDPGLRIRFSLNGVGTCGYGLNGSIPSLTVNLYNPDNPNRPDPSVPEAQAEIDNAPLARQPGSSLFCSSTAVLDGYGTLKGLGGSGVFGQTLYFTP